MSHTKPIEGACTARAIHESRRLIQARPKGQDVDLKRKKRLLLPHLVGLYHN